MPSAPWYISSLLQGFCYPAASGRTAPKRASNCHKPRLQSEHLPCQHSAYHKEPAKSERQKFGATHCRLLQLRTVLEEYRTSFVGRRAAMLSARKPGTL